MTWRGARSGSPTAVAWLLLMLVLAGCDRREAPPASAPTTAPTTTAPPTAPTTAPTGANDPNAAVQPQGHALPASGAQGPADGGAAIGGLSAPQGAAATGTKAPAPSGGDGASAPSAAASN